MGGITAIVLAVIGLASYYLNRPAFDTLYVGLDRSDVNQIGMRTREIPKRPAKQASRWSYWAKQPN